MRPKESQAQEIQVKHIFATIHSTKVSHSAIWLLDDDLEPQSPSLNSEQELEKIDEIRINFFTLMDVLEEYTEERLQNPL